MAIQLHHSSDVGTTYKRALIRINPAGDRAVSSRSGNSAALRHCLHYDGSNRQDWRQDMRKPRDFNSELKALTDKAKLLKARKVQQLGELVIATGADAFDVDVLTGALLAAVENKDSAKQEA